MSRENDLVGTSRAELIIDRDRLMDRGKLMEYGAGLPPRRARRPPSRAHRRPRAAEEASTGSCRACRNTSSPRGASVSRPASPGGWSPPSHLLYSDRVRSWRSLAQDSGPGSSRTQYDGLAWLGRARTQIEYSKNRGEDTSPDPGTVLFGKTRRRVLGLLFGHPGRVVLRPRHRPAERRRPGRDRARARRPAGRRPPDAARGRAARLLPGQQARAHLSRARAAGPEDDRARATSFARHCPRWPAVSTPP